MKKSIKTKRLSGLFFVILAAVIGGGIPVFLKISLQQMPLFTFTLTRFLLASFILLPFFLYRKEKFSRKNLLSVILISFLATANIVFYAFGIKRTAAIISQMLYAGVPILASIFSYLLLREKFSKQKIIGIILGFFGVLFIILLPIISQKSVLKGDLLGNLLIFGGVLTYSLYTVFSKKLQASYSPLSLTLLFTLTTIFSHLFLAPLEIKAHPFFWQQITLLGIISLLYVAVLGTSLYFLIYQYAIKKSTPVIASLIYYLQPILSFVWAFLFLGERLTLSFIIGGTLAFLGATLVNKNK